MGAECGNHGLHEELFPLVLPWLTVRVDDGSRGGCNTFYALSSRFEALLGCIPVLRFAGAVALLLGNGVQVCFRQE